MMKTRIITVTLMLISCFLNGQNTFHKTYGGMGQDHASCVRQTNDGGYVIIGNAPAIVNVNGAYVIKIDLNGDTLWTQILGNCRGTTIRQTADGGYIIGGSTPDALSLANSDIVIIKLDAAGNLVWNRQFPRYSADYATAVLPTNEGGYIVAGYFIEPSMPLKICLIKTDSVGNMLWSKFWNGIPFDNLNSLCYLNLDDNVQQTHDNGYIITGTCITGVSNTDAFLIKLNDQGDFAWMKTYENTINTCNDYGNAVQETSDYGFMVIGNIHNTGSGLMDPYLLKTDSMGNFEWNKTYHGTYNSNSRTAVQTSDDGYIIGVNNLDSQSSLYDIGLIKTDFTGNISWSKLYGGLLNDDYAASIEQTSDGGYIIAGSRFDAVNDFEYYLIKTNSAGNSGCFENNYNPSVLTPSVIETNHIVSDSSGIATNILTIVMDQGGVETTLCSAAGITANSQYPFSVFPNPANEQINISFPATNSQTLRINIFSITGEIIYAAENKIKNNFFNKVVDVSDLQSGIYIIKAFTEKETFQLKLIITR